MASGDQWISLPHDALWDIGAGLVDADVDNLEHVVTEALAAAAKSANAVVAGAWRNNLDTGLRTRLYAWVKPGTVVPELPETMVVWDERLLESVTDGGTVVPLSEIAIRPGPLHPDWAEGTAAVILISHEGPNVETVAFVRQHGGWTPDEIHRLTGFGAILRQFLGRAAIEKSLQLRLHLADMIRDCVTYLSHADDDSYEQAIDSTLHRIAAALDLTSVALVRFGSDRASTEHFVGEAMPECWLDLKTLGEGRFVTAESGPQRHALPDVARAFFGDESPAVAQAIGMQLSLIPARVSSSTPALLAAVSPEREWDTVEVDALELVAQSLIETRARVSAERWSAERLVVQEHFAATAAAFVRTPPDEARQAISEALVQLASLVGSPAASIATIEVDDAVAIPFEWTDPDTHGSTVVWQDQFTPDVLRSLMAGETSIRSERSALPTTVIAIPIRGARVPHVAAVALAGQKPLHLDGTVKLLTAFADLAGSLLTRTDLEELSERQDEARRVFRSIRRGFATTARGDYDTAVLNALTEIGLTARLGCVSILDVDAGGLEVRNSSCPETIGELHRAGSDTLIDLAVSTPADRGHLNQRPDGGASFAAQFHRSGRTSVLVAWGALDILAEASLNRLATLFTELERRLETEGYTLAAFEKSPTGALICDSSGLIVRCNQAFADFIGYPAPDDLIGLTCSDLYGSDRHVFSDEPLEFEFQNRLGEAVLGLTRSVPLEGPERGAGVWLVHVEDVTERRGAEQVLRHQANHDELTGMLNRRSLNERCEAMLDGDGSLAVLLIDLDRFKLINDSLGHASGDELLIEIARRVGVAAGPTDVVARIGGDEFGVAIAGPTTLAAAQKRAAELLQLIAEPHALGQQQIYPSASIGIAVADAATTFQELMRQADAAMYRAKAKGRNRHETFDRDLSDQLTARMATEAGLRRALVNDELRVHYQPEVSLTDGRLLGAEALIRWKHPDQGLVPAASFIEVAEDTGVIVDIGALVLYEACARAVTWPQSLAVRVNFSAAQLQRSDTVTLVRTALDISGLAASRLCVEITESAMMVDIERAETVLGELRKLGVSIAVDDFGTGFSSLAYLKRFPVDTLKIDRAFVQDIGTDAGLAFIRAIVSLAESLGLDVVAEGVETQKEADALVELGCTRAQGYFFGRPAPEARLRTLFD